MWSSKETGADVGCLWLCRAVETAVAPSESTAASTVTSQPSWSEMSYSKQYDKLFSQPLDTKKAIPKPDKQMQAAEEGNTQVLFSDVRAVGKRPLWERNWSATI